MQLKGLLALCSVGFLPCHTQSVILNGHKIDNEKYPLAKCNNGGPPSYFVHKPTGTNIRTLGENRKERRWLVYLQGGGWCYDLKSCQERPRDLSGYDIPEQIQHDDESIFGSSKDSNPALYDAIKVYVAYCSSDGWTGDADLGGTPNIQVRGQRIVDAVMKELVVVHGLGSAPGDVRERVILGGCSAGARGAMYNIERAASLPDTYPAKLKPSDFFGFFDSGHWVLSWVNDELHDGHEPPLLETLKGVYKNFNVGDNIPASCTAGNHLCLIGEYRARTYDPKTSSFGGALIAASLHDSFLIGSSSRVKDLANQTRLSYEEILKQGDWNANSWSKFSLGIFSQTCNRHCVEGKAYSHIGQHGWSTASALEVILSGSSHGVNEKIRSCSWIPSVCETGVSCPSDCNANSRLPTPTTSSQCYRAEHTSPAVAVFVLSSMACIMVFGIATKYMTNKTTESKVS